MQSNSPMENTWTMALFVRVGVRQSACDQLSHIDADNQVSSRRGPSSSLNSPMPPVTTATKTTTAVFRDETVEYSHIPLVGLGAPPHHGGHSSLQREFQLAA